MAAAVVGRGLEEAEALLREYLGGANDRRQRIDLATPIMRSSEGAVSLYLPGILARASLAGPWQMRNSIMACWARPARTCVYSLANGKWQQRIVLATAIMRSSEGAVSLYLPGILARASLQPRRGPTNARLC